LNQEDEEAYVKKVQVTVNPETPVKTIELDEEAQKYIAGILYAPVFFFFLPHSVVAPNAPSLNSEKVDAWLQTSPAGTPLELPPANSFHRRVIYEQISKKYNSFLTTDTVEGTDGKWKEKVIRVSKLSQEEKDAIAQKKAKAFDDDIKGLVGFRQVVDVLFESKKPIIGHNAFIDLIQIYAKFYRTPPRTLVEFKTELLKLFPL